MSRKLIDYKNAGPIEYLDGRYFNSAMNGILGALKEPLILSVTTNGVTVMNKVNIPKNNNVEYLRMIVEFAESTQSNQSQMLSTSQLSPRNSPNNLQRNNMVMVPPTPFNTPVTPTSLQGNNNITAFNTPVTPTNLQGNNIRGSSPILMQPSPQSYRSSQMFNNPSPLMDTMIKVISRHSNLLIIDNVNKKIRRFEPLKDNIYDNLINAKLMEILTPDFNGYDYRELSVHPQTGDSSLGLCVAYVIKFAYFHAMGEPVSFEGDYDIYMFGKAVIKEYGILPGNPDIEFGHYYGYNPLAPTLGILGGIAIGGLIGGALAGTGGALAGATLGGIGGGLAAAPFY